MHLSPFKGPFAKIEQAGRRLAELNGMVEDYQKSVKPTFVKIVREEFPWEIQSNPEIPLAIPLIIGEIAHSLRSALDVMMCDIAAVRQTGMSDMKFPFDDSKDSFLRRLAGPTKNAPFRKLGPDIVSLICECQPYNGGNDLLRGLHDLNVQDKHRTVLSTAQYAAFKIDMRAMILSAINETLRGMPVENVSGKERLESLISGGVSVYYPLSQPTVSLKAGEPIPSMFYVQEPGDGLTLLDEPPRIVFPDNYFLKGEVISAMSKLTESTLSLIKRFETLVRP